MMTIEEMRAARERLHYTYEMLSEKSGVPLTTIQKVFSGTTRRPHFKTMDALEAALKRADKSRYEQAAAAQLLRTGKSRLQLHSCQGQEAGHNFRLPA